MGVYKNNCLDFYKSPFLGTKSFEMLYHCSILKNLKFEIFMAQSSRKYKNGKVKNRQFTFKIYKRKYLQR